MTKTRIYIDNSNEINAKMRYPKYRYDGSLLPFERITETLNGKTTNFAMRLLREPPLIDFARKRKQITTIPIAVLQSGVPQTNGNIDIEDYLLERIAFMQKASKDEHKQDEAYANKIVLDTLYKALRITRKDLQKRALETVKKYLDHYKKVIWIQGYKITKDYILIYV